MTASLPGASPETMASSVATPLERQFSTIAGISSMISTNSVGTTQITLQFDLDRDIDGAAQDVQAAITQAAPFLPPDMPSPPTFRKVNPADQPILYIGLTSATLPLYTLDEYGETLLAQRISMVSGVAQVQVFGAQKYAVRVQLDPKALASRGIGIDEVAESVRSANVNLPTGTLQGSHRRFTVQATGQLTDAVALPAASSSPIATARPVRLEELGHVIDSVEDDKTASWYRRRREAPALGRAGGPAPARHEHRRGRRRRSRRCCRASRRSCRRRSSCTSCSTARSRSSHSVNDVKFTLVLALALVVMVIFLFLRNLSATVIPSLALPLSIVGTFAVMYPLGYQHRQPVADGADAVGRLRRRRRHRHAGEHRPPHGDGRAAAARPRSTARSEIGFTILSMTLSLAAVFIPVLFMPGILGRLFHEFAVTICVAILISGFVSLSLTPMLCSRFLRPSRREQHGRFYQATERVFDALLRVYERSLRWVLRHRPGMMAASLLILVATAWLFVRIPKGFIPDEDQGAIFAITEAAQGVSFDAMVRHQTAVADIVRAGSQRAGAVLHRGRLERRRRRTTNQGRIFIHLKPHGERPSIPVMMRASCGPSWR